MSSDTIAAREGTAQGSILGHLTSYVNDMQNCITKDTCYEFADYTGTVVAEKDPIKALAKIQTDLDTLPRWCHDLGLAINSNKTK